MTITLYTTSDDVRKLNKTVNKIKDVESIFPTGNINVYSPTFIIDYDSTAIPCNYLYCDTTGLYYFVSSPVLIDGRRMELNCKCDYLMSFATEILNCNATVVRRESFAGETGGTYIQDSKMPIDTNKIYIHGERLSHIANTATGNYFLSINGG